MKTSYELAIRSLMTRTLERILESKPSERRAKMIEEELERRKQEKGSK